MRTFFKVLSAILGLSGIFTIIAGVSAVEKELSYIWIVGIGIALFVFGAVITTVIYDKEGDELVEKWCKEDDEFINKWGRENYENLFENSKEEYESRP